MQRVTARCGQAYISVALDITGFFVQTQFELLQLRTFVVAFLFLVRVNLGYPPSLSQQLWVVPESQVRKVCVAAKKRRDDQ